MSTKRGLNGGLHLGKGGKVFVASGDNQNGCPTLKLPDNAKRARIRDDYTKVDGLRVSKSLIKLIFK